MFGHRAQDRRGQKQQRAHQQDGSQKDETKSGGVGAHGSRGKRSWLLGRQTSRNRQRSDNGDEATDQHHQTGGDVPVRAEGRGGRGIVFGLVETPRVGKSLEAGPIIGGRRTKLVKHFRESV